MPRVGGPWWGTVTGSLRSTCPTRRPAYGSRPWRLARCCARGVHSAASRPSRPPQSCRPPRAPASCPVPTPRFAFPGTGWKVCRLRPLFATKYSCFTVVIAAQVNRPMARSCHPLIYILTCPYLRMLACATITLSEFIVEAEQIPDDSPLTCSHSRSPTGTCLNLAQNTVPAVHVQVSGGVDADAPGEGPADAATGRAHRCPGPDAAAVQFWRSSSGKFHL